MSVVHLTAGLPASGKTTFARTLDGLRFNRDEYRDMMGIDGDRWTVEREFVPVHGMLAGIVKAVDSGYDVVIDNTHLTKGLPGLIRRRLAFRDVTYRVHDFNGVSVEECIRRDALRPAPVGADVIRNLAERRKNGAKGGWKLTAEWMAEGLCRVEPYPRKPLLPVCIIVDIDGTLAIHSRRGPYDLERLDTDTVNEAVAEQIRLYRSQGYRIILLSGRKGEYRKATEAWLAANKIRYHELHMRPVGDPGSPDYMVKRDLFEAFVRGVYDVEAVLDDRDQVVELWRRGYHLFCEQVGYGDF